MTSTLHVVGLPPVPRERVDPAPLCPCHGQAMRWNKCKRLIAGGHWRCTHAIKASERRVRLRKFGMDEQAYDRMLREQGGVCAICAEPPGGRWNRLAVDHDHATGQVRGLLCTTCNTMLGRLERRLTATMEYLGRES